MSAHVKSRVYGGTGTTTSADLDRFGEVAKALESAALAAERIDGHWQSLPIQLRHRRSAAPFCPKLGGTAASGSVMADGSCVVGGTGGAHVSLDYAAVTSHANARAAEAAKLSSTLQDLSDRIIRAYSLYSNAEHAAARIVGEMLQLGALTEPGYAAGIFAALAGASVLKGSLEEGRFNPIYAVTDSWWAQEGLLAALGTGITNGTGGKAKLHGAVSTNEVNEAAGKISEYLAPLNNAAFGDRLMVTRIRPLHGIGETRTIADSLTNVHDMRLNKVDYGSIAIQRYLRDDGTTAWMVTVPGTDGHFDSPFSWQTNVELMSSDAEQRKAADSARMVDEAMSRAGIGPDDPVAIVGHSQGGIVAATMAADFSDKYNIQHIVTAGSPVANHPIGPNTWVTSIEVNDELVSNLDGAQNPMSPTWLTVRGMSQPLGVERGTAVENTGDGKSITHDMNYMKATWRDAEKLGSTALQGHERHFREVIGGELKETTYWRGRISK
ncbi:hypothetical protein CS006_09440 [Bifidobacterium primatium]|uniref:GPI inositol-deacylase PGAP1-like alpha/beta domain-containing protein n=1 Tax=Bifidobacterium primatium TaxID=2045438 RepID=A0A2M9H7H6_9BIFI|nr:alpha/beta fold hydrolase [Bifidobacterium primatium]PJM72771.1 hypothetical protein CS006_09440 [Bifidobacterium primatium]